MMKLLNNPQVKPLLSDEHFSVDGTLLEAWASHKSFKPKDGSDSGDGANWHKQKRSNETHASTTDPESRLYRKAVGREARLCFMGARLSSTGSTPRPDAVPPGQFADRRLRNATDWEHL
jgi:hypothetical protein